MKWEKREMGKGGRREGNMREEKRRKDEKMNNLTNNDYNSVHSQ